LTRARDVANVLSTSTALATDAEVTATLANYKVEVITNVSSNITMVAGRRYIVDTTSARTLTLPASASAGDEIQVVDGSNNAATNNITISRNSHKINGVADNGLIDVNGIVNTFIYTGTGYGWRMI